MQGMYRSAHYVWFVNHEDFRTAIREQADASPTEDVWFFSGYDCDSLALDAVTGFCADFVPFFQQLPNAWLELRSKSAQTAMLERLPPSDRCVVAYSFTPQALSDRLEPGVPALEKRVRAMQRLTTLGWPLGLRFDPLIYDHDYRHHYGGLFEQLFSRLQADRLHSVSIGALRMPRAFFKTIHRLYPEERLFAGPLRDHQGMIGYRADIEEELRNFCLEQLRRHVPEEKLFPCW